MSMKILENNAIQSITASSEDPAYPASNLLDSHPKKKWKAADGAVSFAQLDVQVNDVTGGLGMVGIVADAAAVSIEDPSGVTWDAATVTWDNIEWDAGSGRIDLEMEFEQGDDFATLWVDFEEFDSPVTITVSLYKNTGTLDTIAAGVAVCGRVHVEPSVNLPLNEGLQDYSIERQLANGSWYYRQRNIVRTFSGAIRVRREDFWTLMRGLARKYGKRPMMYKISDTSGEWILYARFEALLSGVHDEYEWSLINFQLLEVV